MQLTTLYQVIKKCSFLALLCVIFVAFFYFHLYEYFTLKTLKIYQLDIQLWTSTHYKAAVSLYLLTYITLIACAIPCATFLTLLGGFLFGSIAVLYSLFSTTCGGVILFLAVRFAIGSHISMRSSGWIKKMESGFQKNAFHYLLMLRLIPILPCWISNIAAGALNVPLKTFVFATILGLIPSTIIYVMAGESLDKLIVTADTSFLNTILTPSVFLPLLGLAILSLFPIIYKHYKND